MNVLLARERRCPEGISSRIERSRFVARRLERRQQRGEDAAERDERRGEANHPAVDRHVQALRNGRRQAEDGEEVGAPAGRDNGRRTADDGEQEPLERELPDDPCPRRPERGADAGFALPIGRAREQQAGDVEAGEQQDEPDDGERVYAIGVMPRTSGCPSGIGQNRRRARLRVGAVSTEQRRRDALQVGGALRRRDATTETADQAEPRLIAGGETTRETEQIARSSSTQRSGSKSPPGPWNVSGSTPTIERPGRSA